jgi:hypothetical protein
MGDVSKAGPEWRRSSRCDSATCIEVLVTAAAVAIRDGKDPDGPMLRFAPRAWQAFIEGVKGDDLTIG